MLVISRKPKEGLICRLPNGDEIFIRVDGRGTTKVSIDAPASIVVVREEIAETADYQRAA